MALEDLSWMPDEDLYALEQRRTLAPDDWGRIDAELRRRRTGRRAALADVTTPAAEPPTLGDLERVAAALERRLADVDAGMRRLRWWVALAPLGWAVAGVAAWLALHEWAPVVLRGLARLP
ncbi:MAG TPA: hypothetical protein VFS05_15870 [Gemmatimonadaceae bacterium]|nr:hypothetical protein [Gemmatimonadaceae bacterium]